MVKLSVKIDHAAYTKIVFHALKYPHCPIYGLLLGTPKNANGVVSVTDAVPLLHSHPLSTFTEAGLEVAHDTFCSTSNIVGVYWASETVTKGPATLDTTTGSFAAKIADRIATNGAGCLLVLEVDNVAISATPHRACLNAFGSGGGISAKREWEKADIEYELEGTGASTIGFYLEKVLKESKDEYRKICDFENLMADPSLDWNNDFVNEL